MELDDIVKTLNRLKLSEQAKQETHGALTFIRVQSPDLLVVVKAILSGENAGFDFLTSIVCSQVERRFEILYSFVSLQKKSILHLKVEIDGTNPVAESIMSIAPSAEFHEREIWELFGVEFNGHKDLQVRRLLPAGWEGFPLRKDYSYPESFGELEHRRPALKKDHVRP